MSLPQIHHYPLLEGSSAILNLLRPSLPISLPLYRRIQFQHFTAFSYLLCSLSPTDLEPPSVSPKKTWIAAFVDRSRRPETEVWVFGSWESMPGDEGREKDQEKEKDELVMGLVAEIGKLAGAEVAEIDHGGAGTNGAENEEEGEGQGSDLTADGEGAEKSGAKRVGRGEYNAHMKGTRIVLVGSVHEKTVDVMRRVGVIAEGFVGAHIPYRKYMFDISRKRWVQTSSLRLCLRVWFQYHVTVVHKTNLKKLKKLFLTRAQLIFPPTAQATSRRTLLGPRQI